MVGVWCLRRRPVISGCRLLSGSGSRRWSLIYFLDAGWFLLKWRRSGPVLVAVVVWPTIVVCDPSVVAVLLADDRGSVIGRLDDRSEVWVADGLSMLDGC